MHFEICSFTGTSFTVDLTSYVNGNKIRMIVHDM